MGTVSTLQGLHANPIITSAYVFQQFSYFSLALRWPVLADGHSVKYTV